MSKHDMPMVLWLHATIHGLLRMLKNAPDNVRDLNEMECELLADLEKEIRDIRCQSHQPHSAVKSHRNR